MAASARVIITADDFGYTAPHNHGIAESFRQGLITHASLMVNMAASEEAIAIARDLGVGDRVGCHLNLAEGAPLTEAIRRAPAFCRDGVFAEPLTRSRVRPLSNADKAALAEEVRAQIAAVRRGGCAAVHLDSHRYVHTWPNLARTIVAVARELGVRRVRPYANCGVVPSPARRALKAMFNRWLAARGVNPVDYFGSIEEVGSLPSGALADRTVEIMTHPRLAAGGDNPAVPLDGSAGPLAARLAELEARAGLPLVASGARAALR